VLEAADIGNVDMVALELGLLAQALFAGAVEADFVLGAGIAAVDVVAAAVVDVAAIEGLATHRRGAAPAAWLASSCFANGASAIDEATAAIVHVSAIARCAFGLAGATAVAAVANAQRANDAVAVVRTLDGVSARVEVRTTLEAARALVGSRIAVGALAFEAG